MREMTASDVARNFSAVLDGAEGGEPVVITRNGRRVALLVPAPRANGRAVGEVIDRWRTQLAVDDAFADAVASADRSDPGLDADPWRD
jgi:prevent-host-death family protein